PVLHFRFSVFSFPFVRWWVVGGVAAIYRQPPVGEGPEAHSSTLLGCARIALRMKVTVVNASDTGGGAADAARGIYTALRRHTDIEARMLVGACDGGDRRVRAILSSRKQLAQRVFRGVLIEPTVGQDYWLPFSSALENHPFVHDADVLNLHNIHGGYFAYPCLTRLA